MKCRVYFFILFICFSASLLDAQMYYWVDKNGVKHYSNRDVSQDADTYKTLPEVEIDDNEIKKLDDGKNTVKTEEKIESKDDSKRVLTKEELDKMEKECVSEQTGKWMNDHELTFIGDTPDDYIINASKRNEENAKEYAKDVCAKRRLQLETANGENNAKTPAGNESEKK